MRWVAKLSNSGIKFDFKELKSRSFGSIFLWFVKMKCNKFIAITSNIQKELLQAGIPRDKIEVIPNGVCISKSLSNTVRKSDLDCAKDDIVFVQVSRLTDVKNHKMIISAASKISQRNFKILFIGDGPNRDKIKHKIDELNMGNHIKLIGAKQNIDEYYQISDVFLLPSIAEGLSNALLEACVHGVYPVVSNLAGNREVLVNKNKQLGLLLDPLDEKVWVESMSNICRNGIGSRLENGSIIHRYSINNVVQKIYQLYSRVVE
jgi:glycosyltransferase involved in cell wall biosynthesis